MALDMQSIPADWLAISFDVAEEIRGVRSQLVFEIKRHTGRCIHASFYLMKNTPEGRAAVEAIRNKYQGRGVNMWVLPSHFFDKTQEMRAAYDEAFKADLDMINKKLDFIERAYAQDELNAKPKEGGEPRPFTLAELDSKLSQLSRLFTEVDSSIAKRKQWEKEPEKQPMFDQMEKELRRLEAVRTDLSLKIHTRMKANGLQGAA